MLLVAEGDMNTMHVTTTNAGIFGAVRMAVLQLSLDVSNGFNRKYWLDVAAAVCRASRDISDGQGP